MRLQAALIKEQGVIFVVVVVRAAAMSIGTRDRTARSLAPLFPGRPVVLMSQDGSGRPTFYGRRDLVRFLSDVPLTAMPWREFEAA